MLLVDGEVHGYWRIDPVRLKTALLAPAEPRAYAPAHPLLRGIRSIKGVTAEAARR